MQGSTTSEVLHARPFNTFVSFLIATARTHTRCQWTAVLTVQEGPFQGGLFEFVLELPAEFQSSSSSSSACHGKFLTPLTHPNVDSRSGEVTGQWAGTIGQTLEALQRLLVCPKVNNPQVKVRNEQAKLLWETNRRGFDDKAREEVRSSWLSILKPRQAASASLICDLLLPPKRVSYEAQHETFRDVGIEEIEIKYGNKETESEDANDERRRLNAKEMKHRAVEAREGLEGQLAKTLVSLIDLNDTRATRELDKLEHELADLYEPTLLLSSQQADDENPSSEHVQLFQAVGADGTSRD